MEWKDETSYSRGELGKVEPDTWVLHLPTTRIAVHRHINHPGKWVLTCRRLGIELRELDADDVETAKRVALQLLELAVLMVKKDLEAAPR